MNTDNKQTLLQLLAEHKNLGITEQIDYDKFYLYSIITHSTAIEGSTVTEIEAQLLFDEGITSSKRTLNEMNMNLDLKDAYIYGMDWIKRHEDISVEWLIGLSAKVMAHTGSEYRTILGDFSAAKGELRKLNVTAGFGGKSYMSYTKVPQKLRDFCKELNRRRKTVDKTDPISAYELSFWTHFELVTIHPWADGNGRMSRLLMNLIQFEFGLLPTKVLKEDKAEYIQALESTREEEDIEIFINTMTSFHCQHLKSDIAEFKKMAMPEVDRKGGQKTTKGGQKTRDAILALIAGNAKITSTQMAEQLGMSRSAISKHIKYLQENNKILRIGPDKGGYWKLVE